MNVFEIQYKMKLSRKLLSIAYFNTSTTRRQGKPQSFTGQETSAHSVTWHTTNTNAILQHNISSNCMGDSCPSYFHSLLSSLWFVKFSFSEIYPFIRSRNSTVGIATGYGLDDRTIWVRVPVASKICSSPLHPDRFWGPPSLPFNGYGK
jgi:hypothetical protein